MWIPERVNQRGKTVPAFQIDACFAEEIGKHTWYLDTKGYMRRSQRLPFKKARLLHREVWNLAGRKTVKAIDHINGDPLDNRLDNLRAATTLLNNKNNRRRRATRQGLPLGVMTTQSGKFMARISHFDTMRYLGTFDTAEEAAAVYQNAKEILIEFANLPGYENVIKGGAS